MHAMDGNTLSIAESISRLELSVDRTLAGSSRDEVVLAETRLQVLLRGMRGYLNSLAPINSLPPEMLVAIFKEVIKSCPTLPVLDQHLSESESKSDQKRAIDTRPLFRLIHVCRLWRGAALGDASFWAHVDVSLPEAAVRFFLRHSSGYPLTLHASSEKARLVQRILEKHGARVRAVYVDRNLREPRLGVAGPFFPHAAAPAAVHWQPAPPAFPPGFGLPAVPAPAPFAQPGPAPFAQPGPAPFAQFGAAVIAQPQAALVPAPLPWAAAMQAALAPLLQPQPAAAPLPGLAALQQAAVLRQQGPVPVPVAAPIPGAPIPGAPIPGAPIPGAAFFPQLGPASNAPLFLQLDDLALGIEDTTSSVFKYFCYSAPQLECFMLRELRRGSNPSQPFGLGRVYLPPLASALSLKALALVLSDAYFPARSFPNLTHLYVSFPLPGTDDPKSLLQMLSRVPSLQFLQLSNLRIHPNLPAAFVHPHPHVSLGQLRLLMFSDVQLETAFFLLKHLALPEPVLLSIEGSGGTHHFGNGFPDSLRPPSVAPLNVATFMEISISNQRTLLLTGYDAHFTSSFLLKVRDFGGFWKTSWLPSLHDMMALSMITTLHISDDGGAVFPQLLPYFVQLEQLSILLMSSVHGSSVNSAAGALFACLTPVTTLVCPALHSLGLQADIEHFEFPLVKLEALAVARHERGLPIRRFVYQFHGTSLPVWALVRPAKEVDRLALIEASLSPRLEPYVDSIEYRLSSGERVCPFVPRECWRVQVPDAERYWRVSSDKQPSYGMPWEKSEPVHGDGEAVRQPQAENDDEDLANLFDPQPQLFAANADADSDSD